MTSIVVANVQRWQSWGGQSFNWFTAGASSLRAPWGSYTLLYDMRVPSTPKTVGVRQLLETSPALVTAGMRLPLRNHSAAEYVGYYTPTGALPSKPVVTWLPKDRALQYLVRREPPDRPCTLTVTVWMTNRNRTSAGTLEVSVGSFLPARTIVAPDTGGNTSAFVPVSTTFPDLPAAASPTGLVTVQLRVPIDHAAYYLKRIDVVCTTSNLLPKAN